MGRSIAHLAADDDQIELLGGIGRHHSPAGGNGDPEIVTLAEAGDLMERADVIIDFSAPSFLRELLERFGTSMETRALVVGTTGLEEEDQSLLDVRAEEGAVITAANFSVGVNVLLALVTQASAALQGYDVEIVEAHHRMKEDAPSGTALALGNAVAAGRGVELSAVRTDGRSGRTGRRPEGEIGFHALRGGGVVGDHQVHFLGEMERIQIAHAATDRAIFAAGALRAARWVAGRGAGRYTMRDVLGLS
jgi:4-hydroxy-tetrahydrodipicolinate reductase